VTVSIVETMLFFQRPSKALMVAFLFPGNTVDAKFFVEPFAVPGELSV